jgi:hypothetical protein
MVAADVVAHLAEIYHMCLIWQLQAVHLCMHLPTTNLAILYGMHKKTQGKSSFILLKTSTENSFFFHDCFSIIISTVVAAVNELLCRCLVVTIQIYNWILT